METKTKIECISHGSKLTKEERAHFNRKVTTEEFMEVLRNGASGRVFLMSRRDNPDDNVVVEYVKVEDKG
ncbi:hypothetical protein A3C18_03210 [Candidatus Kaiserbacteria bacterium RIFCSPHIGHO2_02_FULL_54_11b]|uniref:Uncharacterized protein n=2 Tax=Candidatus Kaiseribacteriota TaxID=1752734 RepID=A0A1F6CR91_9BACT|nr:MAG: hypothetical protein A2704_02480 [Candidatus Kaiserbacteria bacterium RIFCSPHIGHO2_01_FULL_54_36b]OGG63847.1 MAG: hypothetical protein A3C18_03210 [Candidatus Kaiserbacteria bacterium RIFCSPHIGHO2_02_FULL_54_11b]